MAHMVSHSQLFNLNAACLASACAGVKLIFPVSKPESACRSESVCWSELICPRLSRFVRLVILRGAGNSPPRSPPHTPKGGGGLSVCLFECLPVCLSNAVSVRLRKVNTSHGTQGQSRHVLLRAGPAQGRGPAGPVPAQTQLAIIALRAPSLRRPSLTIGTRRRLGLVSV
jgi:hypothetical protein